MKISLVKVLGCCLLSTTLLGCNSEIPKKSTDQLTSHSATAIVEKPSSIDSMKNIITDNKANNNTNLEDLKAQLEQQKQRIEEMSDKQQVLQEKLKRQQFTINIRPMVNANAGRTKQGAASIAYVAFLENDSQFAELEDLISKEISIIPNRESNSVLNLPQDARFIAIKVGLRYTKKRSQFLIPVSSLNFDTPLTLNIGACDVNITDGIDPELTPTVAIKLKYYQQPLVSCL